MHYSKPRVATYTVYSVTFNTTFVASGHNTNSTTTSAQVAYNPNDTVKQTTVLRSHSGNNHKGNAGMQNTVDMVKAAAHPCSIR